MPFLQATSSVAERKNSPLLRDVVRPLESAGLIAATIAATPHKWRGIAILPLRANGNADLNTIGPLGGAWQEVGDRIRDTRAARGQYVRLDLR
jgi:hypothetical protein